MNSSFTMQHPFPRENCKQYGIGAGLKIVINKTIITIFKIAQHSGITLVQRSRDIPKIGYVSLAPLAKK